MNKGEFKKRIKRDSFFVPRSENSIFSGHVIKWQTGWRFIDEAKKEFPWTELNFFDTRDTEEAKDFRKHVYDWFVKWFGSEEVKL